MKPDTLRDARRHLEYARQLVGPPRTEASINSELDRPLEERSTTKDEGDPPLLHYKRALASTVSALEYTLGILEALDRALPYVALAMGAAAGMAALAVGLSLSMWWRAL